MLLLTTYSDMAGHNKWSKVKHKKAITDAKKSKEFSRHAKHIANEVRAASGNTDSPSVKAAIEKARAANMPNDNITRAIERGRGASSGALETVIYEAYTPAGAALIIEGLTDNRNRTAAEVKRALNEYGLTLAEPGAASWAFRRRDEGYEAQTTIALGDAEREKLSRAVEALEEIDDVSAVYTNAV